MTLPSTYADLNCSLTRTLEVVGERWTLLIVRNAFFGISRFGDFAAQLGIPRAILTSRLKSLVQEGVLTRDTDAAGSVQYQLTAKGIALWPVLRAMMNWGDEFYSPAGARHVLRHGQDGGLLDCDGRCLDCGLAVPVPEIQIESGPGFEPAGTGRDSVSRAINMPRRLLQPITAPPPSRADEGKPAPTRIA
jgi:DNA-binding HxlR family transcriptional regulator